MAKQHHCLWCGKKVKRKGDTCTQECYALICSTLARGEPYLRGDDEPPNDLYRQPWARTIHRDKDDD